MSFFKVVISPTALEMLENVQDKRVRKKLAERIEGLSVDPEKQRKALSGDLAGLRSVRAVGQRYRIIYRVKEKPSAGSKSQFKSIDCLNLNPVILPGLLDHIHKTAIFQQSSE